MTSSPLASRRCLNHPAREAVARCTGCSRDFCRECVTEHEARMICRSCLARQLEERGERRRSLTRLRQGVGLALGLLIAWMSFYLLGQALLLLPDDFHQVRAVALPTGVGEPGGLGDATGGRSVPMEMGGVE